MICKRQNVGDLGFQKVHIIVMLSISSEAEAVKRHGFLPTNIPSSHPTRSPDQQHGSFSEGASFGVVLNILACWVDWLTAQSNMPPVDG